MLTNTMILELKGAPAELFASSVVNVPPPTLLADINHALGARLTQGGVRQISFGNLVDITQNIINNRGVGVHLATQLKKAEKLRLMLENSAKDLSYFSIGLLERHATWAIQNSQTSPILPIFTHVIHSTIDSDLVSDAIATLTSNNSSKRLVAQKLGTLCGGLWTFFNLTNTNKTLTRKSILSCKQAPHQSIVILIHYDIYAFVDLATPVL